MEYKFLDTMPDIKVRKRSKYAPILEEWMKTDLKCIKFTGKNPTEKRSIYQTVKALIKRNNWDYTVYVEGGSYNVYVVRA